MSEGVSGEMERILKNFWDCDRSDVTIQRRTWKRTLSMQEAVSDSSTLIHLAWIGHLELLKEFYGKILITPAVWKEVVEVGKQRFLN